MSATQLHRAGGPLPLSDRDECSSSTQQHRLLHNVLRISSTEFIESFEVPLVARKVL